MSEIKGFFVLIFKVVHALDILLDRLPEPTLSGSGNGSVLFRCLVVLALLVTVLRMLVVFTGLVRRVRLVQRHLGSDVAPRQGEQDEKVTSSEEEEYLRRGLQVELVADIEGARNIASPAADTKNTDLQVIRIKPADQTIKLDKGERQVFETFSNFEGRFCSSDTDRWHDIRGRRNPEDRIVSLVVRVVLSFECLETDEESVGSGERFSHR